MFYWITLKSVSVFFCHPLKYDISKTVLNTYSDLNSLDTYYHIYIYIWTLFGTFALKVECAHCSFLFHFQISTQWSTLTHCISNQIQSAVIVRFCFNYLLMDKSFRCLEKYLKCYCKKATAWFILCVGNNLSGISSLLLTNSFQYSFLDCK